MFLTYILAYLFMVCNLPDLRLYFIFSTIWVVQTRLIFECSSQSASESAKETFTIPKISSTLQTGKRSAFIEAVKKRETVLSGFGHRVYKTVGATFLISYYR